MDKMLPRDWKANSSWIGTVGVCLLLFIFGGCAARMEGRSGNTWILGFARVGTEVRELPRGRFVIIKSEQSAPLQLGLEPYGVIAGFGVNGGSIGWLGSEFATNEFQPSRTFGIPLGKGEMPWRWGITHYKIPRRDGKTLIRVNTVRGLDLKLRADDPELRLGYSRTTLTEGESTNGFLEVKFQTEKVVPFFEITHEKGNQ